MDITPKLDDHLLNISGYGRDGIVIDDAAYHDALILFPTHLIATMVSHTPLEDEQSYTPFINAPDCSIVLVGTGAVHQFISPAFKRHMRQTHGLTLETMDTGAACRTFNVLISESRPVAALLHPVSAT